MTVSTGDRVLRDGSLFDDQGSSLPTLELRVPISPTDKDMRMLRYLLESIQAYGGPISRAAHCAVSVGADEPPHDLAQEYRWCGDYSVAFHWLDRDLFQRQEYDATGFTFGGNIAKP